MKVIHKGYGNGNGNTGYGGYGMETGYGNYLTENIKHVSVMQLDNLHKSFNIEAC